MNKAMIRILIRVIKRRFENGESLEDIFLSYPKLTDQEKEEIKVGLSA